MNFAAVFHRAQAPYSYARNEDELVIRLQTDPDVEQVFLHWGDPFEAGILGGAERWHGERMELPRPLRLRHVCWWTAVIRPPYKRCRYHFELHQNGETWLFGEDGFCTPEEQQRDGAPAAFYQPWMNPSDVPSPPQWVRDTVWYQIFPDRFRRAGSEPGETPWRTGPVTNGERFGGNLAGIREKLGYLRDLGVNGLYLTPIFAAGSVHKYDTESYERVDPDFGTNEEFAALVKEAHDAGIRVMVDAVFNHGGGLFAPWRDVGEKGPASAYWEWFLVNRWPLPEERRDTRDGRYYSFAFSDQMPKLNTNHPEVIEYFCGLCERWVREYGVDGIRFDVGNEVSHHFLREMRRRVLAVRSDVYLLGEIWHDASPWLEGDEYDAVMNYPFRQAVADFFSHPRRTARELGWSLYECLGRYRSQTAEVLFNLLDSHDTDRLFRRAGGEDSFFQQLTLLLTLPGSPSLFYGTEIALPGGHDPDCRRCMPWDELETPENKERIRQVKCLIGLRRTLPDLKGGALEFVETDPGSRFVRYRRSEVGVLLNAGETDREVAQGREVLFCRGLHDGLLAPGGVCVWR